MVDVDLRLGDALDLLCATPAEIVDLAITSPEYDSLRAYGKTTWDFEGIARELYRVLKPGGYWCGW